MRAERIAGWTTTWLRRPSRRCSSAAAPALLTSIALRNPCVPPLDLYLRIENALKGAFATDKTKLSHYVQKILPLAKNCIFSQVASDVYTAVLRDESVIETTWK